MYNSIVNINNKNGLKEELRDFYVPYRKSLDLPSDVTFGLEIEFRAKPYNKLIKENPKVDGEILVQKYLEMANYHGNWHAKKEFNYHLEIISNVLTDSPETWQTLKETLGFITRNGGYYSGVCGAHVHVGKQVLKASELCWLRFMKLWVVFEDYITRFTNGQNYYLRPNAEFYSLPSSYELTQIIKAINKGESAVSLLHNKTYNLNFKAEFFHDLLVPVYNYQDYDVGKTMEFRGANGTLKRVVWQNNVNFYCKFLLACTKDSFDDELLNWLYDSSVGKVSEPQDDDEMVFLLANIVFDNDFDKCCFLRQYYKDFNEPKVDKPLAKSKRFWK